MLHNDDVLIQYSHTQESTRHILLHHQRWVNVLAVGYSIYPRLRLSKCHSQCWILRLKLALCFGNSIGLTHYYVALAHDLTVPMCMFTMSSSVKPVV